MFFFRIWFFNMQKKVNIINLNFKFYYFVVWTEFEMLTRFFCVSDGSVALLKKTFSVFFKKRERTARPFSGHAQIKIILFKKNTIISKI